MSKHISVDTGSEWKTVEVIDAGMEAWGMGVVVVLAIALIAILELVFKVPVLGAALTVVGKVYKALFGLLASLI